jgi:hypothetical protein
MNDCCPDPDICTCDCHISEGVAHIVPCCQTCPHCDGNIVVSAYDRHVAHCAEHQSEHHDGRGTQ